jgi:hypothetical protein
MPETTINTAEVELREIWTGKGVPQARQDELIAEIEAKAQTGAKVGPFTIGVPTNKPEEHVCNPETCPEPGSYYVSAVDGPNWWRMAGPYASHAAALANVNKALHIADKHAGRAWFMKWGTVRMPDGFNEPGRLNKFNLI